jgi:hypothetical protein
MGGRPKETPMYTTQSNKTFSNDETLNDALNYIPNNDLDYLLVLTFIRGGCPENVWKRHLLNGYLHAKHPNRGYYITEIRDTAEGAKSIRYNAAEGEDGTITMSKFYPNESTDSTTGTFISYEDISKAYSLVSQRTELFGDKYPAHHALDWDEQYILMDEYGPTFLSREEFDEFGADSATEFDFPEDPCVVFVKELPQEESPKTLYRANLVGGKHANTETIAKFIAKQNTWFVIDKNVRQVPTGIPSRQFDF